MSESLSNLRRLAELTEKLPPMLSVIDSDVTHSYKEYRVNGGVCFNLGLYRYRNIVTVDRWYLSGGVDYPEHTHEEQEMIFVYEGSMEITFSRDGRRITVKAGEHITVPPKTPHSAYFPERTRAITIMYPSGEYTVKGQNVSDTPPS